MALPFSHDHPPRSAQPSSSSSSSQLSSSPSATSSSSLGSLADGQAYVRGCHHPSARPTPSAIRGWSSLGSLIAPTAATHETNYTGKSGNPQSRRRESIWKRHIVLRFHFLSNAAKLSEFLQLVGKINNALCITVFFLPPSLYLERVLFYMVCEC